MLYLQKWWHKYIKRDFLQPKCDRFLHLFPKFVKIERVATGFEFTEGPIWIAEDRCLLFSDIPASKIFKLSADRRVSIFRDPSDNSNGLTRDRQGRSIACEHGTRRVTRTESDGTIVVVSDRFDGRKLNSPNDIIVKSDGAIYFTDPTYGIRSEQQEQPVQGVYRLAPNGEDLTLVVADFIAPNGLAFSPDERTLYISDSAHERCQIRAFDVQSDGTLDRDRVFCDLTTPGVDGVPDGMKVDRQGRLYATGPGGVWVFEPDGNHLGTIVLPEQPANCAWGDSDWCSLYITAQTSVYKIRVNTPGIAAYESSSPPC
jgi:gluconolactonase